MPKILTDNALLNNSDRPDLNETFPEKRHGDRIFFTKSEMLTSHLFTTTQNVKVKTLSKMARLKLVGKNIIVKRATPTEPLTRLFNTRPNAKLRFCVLIMNAPVCAALSGLSVSLAKLWLNG